MVGFFSKLFGGGKNKNTSSPLIELVTSTVEGLIKKGGFELEYEVKQNTEAEGNINVTVEISGADEELLKDKKGQMLDAFQLIVKRVVQHHFPEDRTPIFVDCGKYREETEAALIERAENLKTIAIEQGKSVYYRALPPKDRKVVHQYLALDPRVKSRSLGEGLYKKIKIYPAKTNGGSKAADDNSAAEE